MKDLQNKNNELALQNTQLQDKVDELVRLLGSRDNILRDVAKLVGDQTARLVSIVNTGSDIVKKKRGRPRKSPRAVVSENPRASGDRVVEHEVYPGACIQSAHAFRARAH